MRNFDQRTKGDFKKDIKVGHRVEANIAVRLCIAKWMETKVWPSLEPNGCGMRGDYIEDQEDVTCKADFLIDGKEVEITRADFGCSGVFHQKLHKIDECLANGTHLVFVNGFKKHFTPPYIWLKEDQVKHYTEKADYTYGIVKMPGNRRIKDTGKLSYRYKLDWFLRLWKPLPGLIKGIPKEYRDILELKFD